MTCAFLFCFCCSPRRTSTNGGWSTSFPSCCLWDSLCSTCLWEWWWRTSTSAGSPKRKRREPWGLPSARKNWRKNERVSMRTLTPQNLDRVLVGIVYWVWHHINKASITVCLTQITAYVITVYIAYIIRIGSRFFLCFFFFFFLGGGGPYTFFPFIFMFKWKKELFML